MNLYYELRKIVTGSVGSPLCYLSIYVGVTKTSYFSNPKNTLLGRDWYPKTTAY